MPGDPFQINNFSTAPLGRAATAVARPVVSWVLGFDTYQTLYARTQCRAGEPFERRALTALDVRLRISDADVSLIPADGPVLLVSNHPHGAVDGLLLAAIVRRRRTDVRVLANHLLSRIPELADLCFFVDPFGGPAAAARSQAGLRAAHLWLRAGGALVVFPAGEVAHRPGPRGSRSDSSWRTTVGRMALTTGARVLPAFIDGTNSRLFYAAGRVHASLRTALLARELLKKRGQALAVRIGAPLDNLGFARSTPDAAAATAKIRRAVEALGSTIDAATDRPAKPNSRSRSTLSGDAMQSDIAQLPAGSCLVESGAFQVFIAGAGRLPAILPEIGRLREVTYRAIGEGTGRSLDIDAFDDRYLHLFSWNRERQQVVGAYRIGQTDRILEADGVDGLYTRTLFRYDERLIARLSPALELGRSFVRTEYQRHYSALLLLWKGIGQFVARHPYYRVLFGPVSISARYSDHSHRLLMTFLQQNHLQDGLADLVEAINPRRATAGSTVARSIEEADKLVAAAETDGKGVPILLRQYLKLNAKLLGFNVDRQFGDALDALMMVDLTTVDAATLNRYLGPREAARFLAGHRAARPAHAA